MKSAWGLILFGLLGCSRTPEKCTTGVEEAKRLLDANDLDGSSEALRVLYNSHDCDDYSAFVALHQEVERRRSSRSPADVAEESLSKFFHWTAANRLTPEKAIAGSECGSSGTSEDEYCTAKDPVAKRTATWRRSAPSEFALSVYDLPAGVLVECDSFQSVLARKWQREGRGLQFHCFFQKESPLQGLHVWIDNSHGDTRLTAFSREYLEGAPEPFSVLLRRQGATIEQDLDAVQPPLCNLDDLWFGWPRDSMDTDTKRTMLVRHASKWTPECRMEALERTCPRSCDELTSGMIVEAAQDEKERAKLISARLSHNSASLEAGEEALAEFRELMSYALRIRRTPRSSAYLGSKRTVEQLAQAIADGNPCLERMKTDHARVRAFREKWESHPELPETFVGMRGPVAYLQSCLDCGDDRSLCDELGGRYADQRENLDDLRKRVEADLAFGPAKGGSSAKDSKSP